MAQKKFFVGPGRKNPSHDILLTDGVEMFGLQAVGNVQGIQELPDSPSNIVRLPGGSEYGDHDPQHSHIQVAGWNGGRGTDFHTNSQVQYYDAHHAWTLSLDKLLPGPQWYFADGERSADSWMPTNYSWRKLVTGNELWIGQSFTSNGFTCDLIYVWLRKVGTPGTLTLYLKNNSAGDPGTTITSTTITDADVSDIYHTLVKFDISNQALSSGTTYHVVVKGGATDNESNCWEVAVDEGQSGANISSDGSSWSASTSPSFKMGYRLTDADLTRRWKFFELDYALYAVEHRYDDTASRLFIEGDRGIATGGGNNTLTDTSSGISSEVSPAKASWVTNEWANAWVFIWKGTGKGQHRQIASNTGTVLTVTQNWEVNPSTDSEWIIYNTPIFQNISPAAGANGIDKGIRGVAVANGIAYFAEGNAQDILQMRYNSATPGHQFADPPTSVKADLILHRADKTDGSQLWIANADTAVINYFNEPGWSTAATKSSDITVGESSSAITALLTHDDAVYIVKTDSVYKLVNKKPERLNFNMDFTRDPYNGDGSFSHENFMFIPWANGSLERIFSGIMDDVGPNRGSGLPANRQGRVSFGLHHPGGAIIGIDAYESGYSSVLLRDDSLQGYHEIFRAPNTGHRITSGYVRSPVGQKPRLFIAMGSDIVFMDLPKVGESPVQDTTFPYTHEAVMETSTIYMGAHQLKKLFDSVTLNSKNLDDDTHVILRYQLDDDIGSTDPATWVYVGEFTKSPIQELKIRESNKTHIRLQLILRTELSTTPAHIRAAVLKGFVRVPTRPQWNLRFTTSTIQVDRRGRPEASPIDLIKWLRDKSEGAELVMMYANDELMDSQWVVVEPPIISRNFIFDGKDFGADVRVTLRGAN